MMNQENAMLAKTQNCDCAINHALVLEGRMPGGSCTIQLDRQESSRASRDFTLSN
jgi:hypothetical protein